MNRIACIFLPVAVVPLGLTMESKESTPGASEIRELCRKNQELETKIQELQREIESIDQREKNVVPSGRDVHKIITRGFSMLLDMQRFSDLLALNQINNCNDFVRGSIVIKNFSAYFKRINDQLKKATQKMSELKRKKQGNIDELNHKVKQCDELCADIETHAERLAKTRKENVIQNDVLGHLVAKSESLEELDAELESETMVGVLKSTKPTTDPALACPVVGKIVSEFGDKGDKDEVKYHVSWETRPNAVVVSPTDGLVVFSGKFLNYRNMLIICHGEYRVFLYGMDVLFSSVGDVVEVGDYVGRMSGKSDHNPIIKMELKKSGEPLDPRKWFRKITNKKEKSWG